MEIPLLIKVLTLPITLRFIYKCMCKCRNCTESECGRMQGIQEMTEHVHSAIKKNI